MTYESGFSEILMLILVFPEVHKINTQKINQLNIQLIYLLDSEPLNRYGYTQKVTEISLKNQYNYNDYLIAKTKKN